VSARAEDGNAVVDVLDTGVGIDAEALERVFDRFYRADFRATEPFLGRGWASRSCAASRASTTARLSPRGGRRGERVPGHLPTLTPLS
jgi:two-component system OmpR family sensor kinase